MIGRLQKKEIIMVMIIAVLAGILGILLLSDSVPRTVKAVRGSIPLDKDADLTELEGSYVAYEVKYPVGQYMEIRKTPETNGKKDPNSQNDETGKERVSYVVIDEARGICLSVQIPTVKCREMEELLETFYDALYEETQLPATGITVQGSLDRLEGEDLKYFREAIEEAGLPDESVVYHISDGMIRGTRVRTLYGFSLTGLCLMLLAAGLLLASVKALAE